MIGRSFRAACAALVLSGTAPATAAGETPSPGPLTATPAACTWLAPELPAGASVQLLVAAGDTIPAKLWPVYRTIAGTVIACAPAGALVTLRAISDMPADFALFAESVPAPVGNSAVNPVRYHAELVAFAARAAAQLDRFPQYGRPETGTDPLSPLIAAGRDLHSVPSAKKLVVLVFNGWWQTHLVDLVNWRKNPADFALPTLRKLRANGSVPDLRDTDVIIAGITSGPKTIQMDALKLAGLCRFWKVIVEAGHGKLLHCAPDIPGVSRPI